MPKHNLIRTSKERRPGRYEPDLPKRVRALGAEVEELRQKNAQLRVTIERSNRQHAEQVRELEDRLRLLGSDEAALQVSR